MKKVFSLWLLDIAKYVVTAFVLSTVLIDVTHIMPRWAFYTACFALVLVIVLGGIYLYKSAEKDENNV